MVELHAGKAEEIEKYINQKVIISKIKLNEAIDFGSLFIFKKHHLLYPIFTSIARFIFCVQASSVPAECMFSHVGLFQSDTRNRLKPILQELLTIIIDNIYIHIKAILVSCETSF